MKVTENKIKLEFKKWATAHGQINSFFWGEPFRSWKENILDFTVMVGYFTNGNFDNNQTGIQINLIFADKKYKNESNVDEIWSDTLQMARDAFQMLNKSTKWREWGKVVGSPTYTKFNNDTGDVLAGHAVQINFALRDQSGICDIPTFGYDYENQTQPSVDCLPVTLFNSNLTWEQIVVSGEVFEVPDTPVTVKDQNSTTLGVANLPSVTGGIVNVNVPSCSDATFSVKKENGELIESGSIPSGDNEDITVNNSVITLNSNPFIEVQATDSLNVKLLDQNEDEIMPLSVVDNVITVNVPVAITRSTAKLLKTGQNWSIGTGDDGNLQIGRETNWLTLAEIPKHNNGASTLNATTNRFTDTLGGQTYANGIVLDWSTWDGVCLLGIPLDVTTHTSSTMANCLTYCNAYSLGGFTGWHLWNRNEANNFINADTLTHFEYAPFNNATSQVYWTSTTKKNQTTSAYRVTTNVGTIDVSSRSGSARAIPVRYFNLSLTNILT